MEIKEFKIDTKEDIVAFFTYLQTDLSLAYHPDTEFADYINIETDEPTFSKEEAEQLDDIMQACFDWCDKNGEDIFEIAMDAHIDNRF